MNWANSGIFSAALTVTAGLAIGGGARAAGAQAEEATQPAPVNREAARALFDTYSCSACHTLTDAGAFGVIGPSLDDPSLTREAIINRVTNGQGAMPSFAGQISDDEIALLADYIVEVNRPAAPKE